MNVKICKLVQLTRATPGSSLVFKINMLLLLWPNKSHFLLTITTLYRYAEWEDPQLETSPYYYGTHYSSAMIVTSYLVRLEPFTQHFLHLQVRSIVQESTWFFLPVNSNYPRSKSQVDRVKNPRGGWGFLFWGGGV